MNTPPEAVAQAFCAALDDGDWRTAVALSDPDSIRRVHADLLTHARDVADPEGFANRAWARAVSALDPGSDRAAMLTRSRPTLAREFGGTGTLEELERMDASSVVELFLASSIDRLRSVTPRRRWLGAVPEGNDLTHVLYRFGIAEAVVPGEPLEIMSLTRLSGDWRVLWTGRSQFGLPGMGGIQVDPSTSPH